MKTGHGALINMFLVEAIFLVVYGLPAAVSIAVPANAYVGPGARVSLQGALWAVIAVVDSIGNR